MKKNFRINFQEQPLEMLRVTSQNHRSWKRYTVLQGLKNLGSRLKSTIFLKKYYAGLARSWYNPMVFWGQVQTKNALQPEQNEWGYQHQAQTDLFHIQHCQR